MSTQPEIQTERLLLRPFTLADAPDVRRLAGEKDIASTTLKIPHPYTEGVAEEWIGTLEESFCQGKGITFAIVLLEGHLLIGAIGLTVAKEHEHAEMGYWVGRPFWGNGYCTEAAKAKLEYGFSELDLNRIFAHYFSRNPASGRVMEKIGMKHEGCVRQHIKKWGTFEDITLYGILKTDRR